MLKSVERLLESGNDLKIGNHSSEHSYAMAYYMYHGSVICEVDYAKKWFKLPYKGQYANSVFTKRAVNNYRGYFLEEGFALVEG